MITSIDRDSAKLQTRKPQQILVSLIVDIGYVCGGVFYNKEQLQIRLATII